MSVCIYVCLYVRGGVYIYMWIYINLFSFESFSIYKKGDEKDIENYGSISFLKLDYKIYIAILSNQMQKTLDTIIGENQSAAIKHRTTSCRCC